MEEALITGIVFTAIVSIVKIITDTTTRRKIIEKGTADPKYSQILLAHPEMATLSSLKWGMVLVGIGIAALVSRWMPYYWSDETLFGLIFLMAGLGMLVYYPIAQRRIKKLQEESKNSPAA